MIKLVALETLGGRHVALFLYVVGGYYDGEGFDALPLKPVCVIGSGEPDFQGGCAQACHHHQLINGGGIARL